MGNFNLAERHARATMKIRFVLHPFSFIFLLTGIEHFHLVMETLDREEATYVWHIDNVKANLPENLKVVEKHLHVIKDKGRQAFLETEPKHFSRILHDYSDDRKGFVLWKDELEERMT